ncbi:MAG: hypothetical protein AAF677_00895 [Pseudomonadota bacterium]
MSQSDSDSFIREVSEQVRQDQMIAYARKYGPLALGAIALLIAGVALAQWLEARATEAARDRGAAFVEAEGAEPEAVAGLVAALDGPAATLGQMRRAQALADAGRTDEAAAVYLAVTQDGLAPRRYAGLAALEAARLQALAGDVEAAELTLGDAILGGGAYVPMAYELRAVLRLNAGDTEGARSDLDAALLEPVVHGETRSRIALLRELLPPPPDAALDAPALPGAAEEPALPADDGEATE